jgi:DNA primase
MSTSTEEIKSRLDIVDIVSESVNLRKSGRSYSGFCPFHHNTRTPSFHVFPDTQTWYCFGECAEGGDLFEFVMKKEGYDFKEALKVLAQRAGVTLEEPSPQQKQRRKSEEKLVDLLTMAAEYFHQLLLHAPQAAGARAYVADRQLNDETVATFHLGFALDSWDACRTHFTDQGYSDDELLAVGLLTENQDKGTRYDRFRNRLMIPIRDVDGRYVGFGARTLDPDGIPKYLNSPQTAVFDKSSLLYGLDTAKRHIREARQAVIVEGYMDVMQGWQAGYRNMVAQMGTALTGEQMQLLKRSSKRFVLALDADAAGQKATMRSLQVARDTLDREYETHFDARGLVQHEGRLQAEIKIVTLPEGYDPDRIIRTEPERWPVLLAEAKPVVAYVIETATRDLDLEDPKAKSAVAQQVLPLIKDIHDEVERDHYRQQLARALRVDERTLLRMPVPQQSGPTRTPPPPEPPPPDDFGAPQPRQVFTAVPDAYKRQANFLRECLEYPHLLLQVNKKLLGQGQQPLHGEDFTVQEDRLILTLLYERADQTAVVAIQELCDSLDEVLAARIQRLLILPVTPESGLADLPKKIALSVLDWRLAAVHAQRTQLQQLLFDPVQSAEDFESRAPIRERLVKLTRVNGNINKAKHALSAAGQMRTGQ